MTGVLEGDKDDQLSSFFLSLRKAGYYGEKPKTGLKPLKL